MSRRIAKVIKKAGEVVACLAMGMIIPAMVFLGPCEGQEKAAEPEPELIRWEQPDTEYDFDYEETKATAGVVSAIYAEVKRSTAGEKPDPWSEEDSYLLAKIAMAEAESQDTEGKALVILTVLNRVQDKQFPDTIEGVIFEECDGIYQFSPIGDGRWDKVEPDADCWEALDLVASGWDESEGACFFEVTSRNPTWHSKNLKKLFEHQDVTFYTRRQ
ncbi:MAG: cell wall hydrolase [Lachnospiraceae bacterium]